MNRLIFAVVAFVCLTSFACADNGLSVAAQHEAARRGSYVEHVGGGLQGTESITYAAAMAPPETDNDKWYLSLYEQPNCPPCDALKRDFATSRDLAPFVNVNDHRKSAMHYHVFRTDDVTQKWRLGGITSGPAVVIQPPLNGKFGDPTQCLEPIVGYHPPGQMAELIRSRIRDYLETLDAANLPMVRFRAADMGIASNGRLPFELPPRDDGYAPGYDVAANPVDVFFSNLDTRKVEFMLTSFATLGALGFLVYREYRRQSGQKVYVNDNTAEVVEKVAKVDTTVIAAIVASVIAAIGKEQKPAS